MEQKVNILNSQDMVIVQVLSVTNNVNGIEHCMDVVYTRSYFDYLGKINQSGQRDLSFNDDLDQLIERFIRSRFSNVEKNKYWCFYEGQEKEFQKMYSVYKHGNIKLQYLPSDQAIQNSIGTGSMTIFNRTLDVYTYEDSLHTAFINTNYILTYSTEQQASHIFDKLEKAIKPLL